MTRRLWLRRRLVKRERPRSARGCAAPRWHTSAAPTCDPNIAHLYGLEESGDGRALVMELVEGPTLADRIAHRPMPFDEALSWARQIADALEAAHARGIIHRDLKPANIKLRPDGQVKVLDFGLARAIADESDVSMLSQSPTRLSAQTLGGVVLGTAA